MILITVSSVITVAATTCNANIDYNGVKKSVQLFSSDTSDILAAAGLKAGAGDLIVRSEEKPSGGDINITVKSAYQVEVIADHTTKTLTMHYGDTVADAVGAQKITLGLNDSVTPSEDTKVSDGMSIEVNRKYNITVTADGKTETVLVTDGSVAKALGQAGIPLAAEDVVSADKSAAVKDGMKLTIARVTYQEVTATQNIAYKDTTVNDKTLTKGVKKIKTAGKSGSQTVVTRKKLIDGKVAASEVVEATVVQQPVNQVTLVGTKK